MPRPDDGDIVVTHPEEEVLGTTGAQVVLRWILHHGVVPIPSSTNPDHVHANADVFGAALSEDERAAIDALYQPLRAAVRGASRQANGRPEETLGYSCQVLRIW